MNHMHCMHIRLFLKVPISTHSNRKNLLAERTAQLRIGARIFWFFTNTYEIKKKLHKIYVFTYIYIYTQDPHYVSIW